MSISATFQEHARTGTHVEQYGMDGQYEGDFMHGMRHGRGRYEFRGEIYNGEWKWDQRHGEGELKCSDGSTIKGSFQNGKPHGMATVVDKNGAQIYEGEFKDGKRDGLGRQNFDSGDMYTGGWKNGRLHDRGVYYFSNGDRLNGMWKEGVYDGVGIFFYADGSKSRREYRDGLLISVQDCEGETQRYGKTLKKADLTKFSKYDTAAIKTQVQKGKAPMPAFGEKLSADDVEDVSAYVREQADKGW